MAALGLIKRFLGGPGAIERREQPRSPVLKGATVLVVDDSATIRAVLGKMLSQDGYGVLKAADGEAAMQVARADKPDLIFLDIVMPGMNGFAVLRALRRDPQTRTIPIVMISGNLQATEQFYVQRFGADDFMKKPFGRGEVFERIRRLLESGRLVLRPPSADAQQAVTTPGSGLIEEEDHDSIPDIGMPDEADLAASAAAPPVPLAVAAPRAPVAPSMAPSPPSPSPQPPRPPPLPPRYPEQQAPAASSSIATASAPLAHPPSHPIAPSTPRHWSDI